MSSLTQPYCPSSHMAPSHPMPPPQHWKLLQVFSTPQRLFQFLCECKQRYQHFPEAMRHCQFILYPWSLVPGLGMLITSSSGWWRSGYSRDYCNNTGCTIIFQLNEANQRATGFAYPVCCHKLSINGIIWWMDIYKYLLSIISNYSF